MLTTIVTIIILFLAFMLFSSSSSNKQRDLDREEDRKEIERLATINKQKLREYERSNSNSERDRLLDEIEMNEKRIDELENKY